CTLPTEGMMSIISIVSISLEGFLPSILLLVVIIVAVVIVAVILVVVVVDAIVGVVIVVASIGVVVVVVIIGVVVIVDGGVPHIIKLSFVIIVQAILLACSILIGWAYAFHHDKASSVKVLVANVTLSFSSLVFPLGLSAACTSRAATIPSAISFRMAASVIVGVADVDVSWEESINIYKPTHNKNKMIQIKDIGLIISTHTIDIMKQRVDLTSDEEPTDEDGDVVMGDPTGVLVSLGDEIFLEGKKSRESNIGDSDNTGDGDKTTGRAIITWGGGIASLISESERTIVE
ncbi:hypothetical protein Tco_1463552, partial [Tanacetum coccineum]